MYKQIPFVKMHALGNDFVILDRVTQSFHLDQIAIRGLAHRRQGIGFDQLLVLEPPLTPTADFSYQVFNSNGSSAKQCLNGLRCLAHYVQDLGLIRSRSIKFQTLHQHAVCESISASVIKIIVPATDNNITHQEHRVIDGKDVNFITMGNSHAICWNVDKEDRGRFLGVLKDEGFTFDKYNISFAHNLNNYQRIFIETYERGAGKTPSCGSAALSTFVASTYYRPDLFSQRIETQTGYVTTQRERDAYAILGPVIRIFSGVFLLRYKNQYDKSTPHSS